ncbi:MAG TPA: Imm26 family immunity protein, partial [Chthonomonadales bacterium]|nr:Imm26 family immunity protein [Chthonomonadales bacterium]
MGTWGAEIFEDDFALDVRDYFASELEASHEPELAAGRTLAKYKDVEGDSDDGPVLYLSLALLLREHGIRAHPVIERSLRIIEAGDGLDRWRESGSATLEERIQVYGRMKSLLETDSDRPAPAAKARVRRARRGDVFKIPLYAGHYGYGRYVYDDDLGPVVEVFRLTGSAAWSLAEIVGSGRLFPPVHVAGLQKTLAVGYWLTVGNVPVTDYISPLYRAGLVLP